MQAFLDDTPLRTDRPTLAAALRAGAARAHEAGRVVVEVFVDGRQATEAMIEQPPDEPIGGEVRLVSVNPRELVRQTFLDCIEALDAANAEQLECARLVQSGKVEDALDPLGQAIATWQAVRDALERGTAMLLGKENLDSPVLGDLLERLAVRLEEIRSALEREDWSALADVLAYDLPEEVSRWSGALSDLAERLK